MGDERGGPGGMAAYLNLTKNGLTKARYVHMTEQVRRMPIGVVLIVDQMHVQDVVRAFANSRLRFQNTQFHWQRFHGGLGLGNAMTGAGMPGAAPGPGFGEDRSRGTPLIGGPASRSTGSGPPIGSSAPPRGEGGIAGASGPPFGGRFGGGPPFGGGDNWNQQQMVEEGTGNLVELSVYGIASIYEKYPPKAPADAGATPPAPPGGPAGDERGATPAATPPATPMGATPATPTPPMPPGGPTNPPPASPPPPAPPAGNSAPPANAGTNPPPATPTPPTPPNGTNPPAVPKTNTPPPGNPML
jgi:hypothetical protein